MARKIKFFEEHFIEFYKTLDNKVKEKVKYVFELKNRLNEFLKSFWHPLKVMKVYLRFELSFNPIFTGFSVVLTRDNW